MRSFWAFLCLLGAALTCPHFGSARQPLSAACDALVYTARAVIHHGLQERGNERGWKPEQYEAVLKALAKAPHGALCCRKLEADAATGGVVVLEALQRCNLLICRAWHPTLRDVPLEVFGSPPEAVYTLPSAAHLVAAQQTVLQSGGVDNSAV